MKRKILIFLAFIPLFLQGQPTTTNRLGYWQETDGITWTSDTTGYINVGDSAVYIIDSDTTQLLWNASLEQFDTVSQQFIDCKSKEKLVYDFTGDGVLDTLPVVTINPEKYNIDRDSLIYLKTTDKKINSLGFEIKPRSVSEIALYSIPTTTVDIYFEVSKLGLDGIKYVDASGGGDYTDINSSIIADYDTIYVRSGNYTNFTIDRQVTIIFQGIDKVYGTGSFGINAADSNFILKGMNYVSNNDNYGIFSNLKGKNSLYDYNYIEKENEGGYAIYLNSYEDVDIRNSVISSNNRGIYLRANINLLNNYIETTSQSFFIATALCSYILSGNVIRSSSFIFLTSIPTGNTSEDDYKNFNLTRNTYFINKSFIYGFDFDTLTVRNDILINTGFESYTNLTDYGKKVGVLDFDRFVSISNTTGVFMPVNNKDISITNSYVKLNAECSAVVILSDSLTTIYASGNTYINTLDGTGPYVLGDDTFVIEDRISGIIENDKIIGPALYGNREANHGNSFWANNNITFRYCYIDGWTMPWVLKGDNTDYSNFHIYGNTYLNGRLVVKGVDSTKIYNNTGIITYMNGTALFTSTIEEGGNNSNGTLVRNNIFANLCDTCTRELIMTTEGAGETFYSNNNLLYNPTTGIVASLLGVDYTFSEWQALGYDANSYNSDPNLNASLNPQVPTDAYKKGATIAGYDSLIAYGATYPNPDKVIQTIPATIGASEVYINLDTIDKYIADTTMGIWTTKSNEAIKYIVPSNDTILIGFHTFPQWVTRINTFIKAVPETATDTINYGVDDFEDYRLLFNAAVDSVNTD